jgi:hypothetical protein
VSKETLGERVRGGQVDPEIVVRLLGNPKFDPRKAFADEDLEDLLSGFKGLGATPEEDVKGYKAIDPGSPVMCYDPIKNVLILDYLDQNGVAHFPVDLATGALDHSKLIVGLGMVHQILAEGGGSGRQIFRRRKNKPDESESDQPDGEPPKNPPKTPRPEKTKIMVTTQFAELVADNVDTYAHILRDAGAASKVRTLEGEDAVACIGVGRYTKMQESGLQLKVQAWEGWLRGEGAEIRRKRKIYITKISDEEKYIALLAEFYADSGLVPKFASGDPDVLELFRREDDEVEITSAEQLLTGNESKSDRLARKIYDWAYEKVVVAKREEELNVVDAVDVVRNDIRSNPIFEELEAEMQKQITTCSALWPRYATAGQGLQSDAYIAEIVDPILEKPIENPKDGTNAAFNVAAALSHRCLRESQERYGLATFRSHMRALWLMERFDSSIAGKTVQSNYINPWSHTVQRIDKYDSLLNERSFTELLENTLLSEEDMDLQTSQRCSALGKRLYNNLSEVEQRQFTHLDSSAQLNSTTSDYIWKVVGAWVGLRREKLVQRYQEAQRA